MVQGFRTRLTRSATECSRPEVRGVLNGTSGTVLATNRAGALVGDVLMYNEPSPDAPIVEMDSPWKKKTRS
jgi:hypothetical protein